MTDLTLGIGNGIFKKLVDMGDGTYAERINGVNSELGTAATDRSGTITLGGTAQNALAVNTARRKWTLINNSDTLMMVNAGGTASATAGIPVYPGDVTSGEETNAISVYGATTGKVFTAWDR